MFDEPRLSGDRKSTGQSVAIPSVTVPDCAAFQEEFSGPNVFHCLGQRFRRSPWVTLQGHFWIPKSFHVLQNNSGCPRMPNSFLRYWLRPLELRAPVVHLQTSRSVSLTPSQAAVSGGPENPNSMLVTGSCSRDMINGFPTNGCDAYWAVYDRFDVLSMQRLQRAYCLLDLEMHLCLFLPLSVARLHGSPKTFVFGMRHDLSAGGCGRVGRPGQHLSRSS